MIIYNIETIDSIALLSKFNVFSNVITFNYRLPSQTTEFLVLLAGLGKDYAALR